MSDLISRQAAIDAIAELQGRAYTKAELKGISKAWKRIKQLPSAEAERKKGRWIRKSPSVWIWTCSCCKKDDAFAYYSDGELFVPDVRENLQDLFCPHCGADMRGEADG